MEARPSVDQLMAALGCMLEVRRGALPDRTISVAVAEGGTFVVDLQSDELIFRGWRDDSDLAVITNQRTLHDLLTGAFDPESPDTAHVWLWGGDPATYGELARAFKPPLNALGARLASFEREP